MDTYYINYLKEIFDIHFTEAEYSLINSTSTVTQFKKGNIPVIQGDVLTHIFIIINGLVRGYYINENGKEATKCFSYEKKFFSVQGLISSDIASFNIECLEDVLCIKTPYDTVNKLKDNNPELNKAFTNIVLKEFVKLERNSKNMLLNDATSRYERFIEEYPELNRRLKQKYIASYLGISPVSLSRLKKSIK